MRERKHLITLLIIIVISIVVFVSVKLFGKTDNSYTIPEVQYNYYKIYSNEKYGVIDLSGNIIIQPQYDDVIMPNPSIDVFICVYDYNNSIDEYSYKIFNSKQEEIFEKYEKVEPIVVSGIIGEIPYEKNVLKYKKDGLYGLISIEGKKITKAIYETIESVPYKEGVLLVKQDGKYGVMSQKGEMIIKPQYDNIIGDGFYNSETAYTTSGYLVTTNTQEGEYLGYLDTDGKLILNTEYDSIYRIKNIEDEENAYIIAKKNGQYGLLQNSKVVIAFGYQGLIYDEEAGVIIAKRNKSYGVMNINGNKVLDLEYDSITVEGIYIVATKDNETHKFTFTGEQPKTDAYIRIESIEGTDYQISIDAEYNYGLLDSNFNVVIPNEYEYLEYTFSNCFIARNKTGKYGIINLSKEEIIPFKYDVIQHLKDTQVIQTMVLEEQTTEIYDSTFKMVYSGKNINVYNIDNYLKITSDKEFKYFDLNGKEVTNAQVYSDNQLLAYCIDGLWGFKDRNGTLVLTAQYETVTEFNEYGFAGIKQNGMWGVIDESGQIILRPTYKITDTNSQPDFIGIYYKTYSGYRESYYTNSNA